MNDFLKRLRDIQSRDVNQTFDPATDSLEALSLAISANQGLCYYGVVTNIVSPTQFEAASLTGHGNSFFLGYRIIVVRQNLGAGALPQLTGRVCTAYVSATGEFTSTAFIPALTVGDEIIVIHPVITGKLVAAGTLTGDSLTQPVDNLRGEPNQFFRGCEIQMLTGLVATQTRAIVYYQAGGIFTLDPSNPFTGLPGAGSAYIIWGGDFPVVAAPNATPTLTPGDVIGNKADTAIYTKLNTASIIRYVKGLMDAGIAISGEVDDAGAAITDFNTNLAEVTNNHYNNMLMLMLTGANAGQSHHIQTYTGAGGNCAFAAGDQWTDVPVTGNVFVILPASMGFLLAGLAVPAVDVATNILERDVIGNKGDVAVLVVSAANSIVAYVKGILQRVNLILSQVLAIFTLKETGGSILTDGNEQDIYRVETPAGVFRPKTLLLDLTLMAAADTVVVRTYYRIVAGGLLTLYDAVTFAGVQAIPLKSIDLLPNRFGIQVTIDRDAGADHLYPFSIFYED